MNGILVVNKPADFTSFDVVAKLRKILHMKKIGHGGTLDPNATGVLPVFLGEATRLCDYMPADDKVYEAEILFGKMTDTEDIWGNLLKEETVSLKREDVFSCISSFQGPYLQTPPMYSAKKVNGKKLYELARNGEEVERKPVMLTIHEITPVSFENGRACFTVRCSKGTYIRTLCTDIAKKLGTVACMSALQRTRHGCFTLSDAYSLDEICEASENGVISSLIRPIDSLFTDLPAIRTENEAEKLLMNGNGIPYALLAEKEEYIAGSSARFRVYDSGNIFRAVYRTDPENGLLVPDKMFLHNDEASV